MNTISTSQDYELVSVADLDVARAQESRERWGAGHAFGSYQELLAHGGLDCVLVATHADTHAQISIAAMQQGLDVLCEKPMAGNLDECRQMCAAAQKHERLLAMNFNTRSGEAYRLIKQQIDQGAVGTIRVVRYVFNWSNHHWTPKERLHNFMLNGGPIIDSGVHFFEGIRWYTGAEFGRINAAGVVVPPYEHPQHVIASCQMSDGSIGLVEAGWLYCKSTRDAGSQFQITVIGDIGTIDFEIERCTIKTYTADGTSESAKIDLDKHFDIVYELWAKSLASRRLVGLASAEDGLRATDAAYRALADAEGAVESAATAGVTP